MDIKKTLEELKRQRLKEAKLWEKLNPDLAVQALIKVMKMSNSYDIQVLLQYSYYLPPDLSEQLYLLGKLYELYYSGYLREPDLKELLRYVKQEMVDKGENHKKLMGLILFLLMQAQGI